MSAHARAYELIHHGDREASVMPAHEKPLHTEGGDCFCEPEVEFVCGGRVYIHSCRGIRDGLHRPDQMCPVGE